jgi:hypothetical protein
MTVAACSDMSCIWLYSGLSCYTSGFLVRSMSILFGQDRPEGPCYGVIVLSKDTGVLSSAVGGAQVIPGKGWV